MKSRIFSPCVAGCSKTSCPNSPGYSTSSKAGVRKVGGMQVIKSCRVVRRARLSPEIVPVSFPRGHGVLVADEAVLEEVEDGELVSRHDVAVRLRLDLAPDV